MRTKGSPNRTNHRHPGQMKLVTVKFRASQEWVDTFDKAVKDNIFYRGKTRSQIIRKIVMQHLIGWGNREAIEIIQNQEENS